MRRFLISLFALGLFYSLSFAADTTLSIGNLTASQGVTAKDNLFTANDELTVSYNLSKKLPVVISIYYAQPLGIGRSWYAHAATLCSSFAATAEKAGEQQFTFKLSDIKPPITPLPFAHGQQKTIRAGDMPPRWDWHKVHLPGNYVIEVRAGDIFTSLTTHLYAAGEILSSNRAIAGYFMGAVRDSKGNILIADRGAWRGRRFTPDWKLAETYPNASLGQSSDPVECFDVAVDSKDAIYLATSNGLYKFSAAGTPATYGADEDYIKCPYPAETRNLLGIRLRNEPGIKRYVFGPGGGGAGSKDYDAQVTVKLPGFSYQWGGAAIDKNDNIYLARLNPDPEIQVFDPTGKFLRKLPLKNNLQPTSMRFGIDGTLWLGCVNNLLGINPLTGNEEKNITNVSARIVHIGLDGTIYLFGGSRVWRFTPSGEVLPFTAAGTTVNDKGRMLNINPRENNVPAGTAGYAVDISSIIGYADGSFELLTAWMDNPHNGKRAVLRFAADGTYQPHTPAIKILPQQTGNVFLDSEPANLALQYCNLANEDIAVTVATTVTNLAEEIVSNNNKTRSIPALSIISASVPLDPVTTSAPLLADTRNYFGYYTINVKVNTEKLSLANERLFGGRVIDRDNFLHPYSPFGSVRMDGNPELMRRIGGGLNRGHSSVYWDEVEPKPGEWQLYPADSLTFLRERSLPTMSILGYGEPWDKGGFPRCRITSYDTFWQYCSRVIRQHKGTPMMWQFWNEPNYFWHVPGPFRYEHYAITLKGVYAIAKAIDPDTTLICDGFAADAQGMKQLGEWGAGNFTDGVPIHYPGVKTISFDNMPITGAVESKADMIKELAAIRDKYYPGREMLNTEEGLWGLANRTPRDGAELLPRIYVTQLAAGIDRLTWFECFSKDDPTYLLRGVQEGPWPAYFAYATASRMLEDAQYVGALSDNLTRVYLFALHGKPLLVAWSMQGTQEYTLPVKLTNYSITDWQGNSNHVITKKSIPAQNLTLQLGATVLYLNNLPDSLLQQYINKLIAQDTPNSEMAAARQILLQGKEKLSLKQLQHVARWEEIARLQNGKAFNYAKEVKSANSKLNEVAETVKEKEANGAYLRETHVALDIARRSAYYMNQAAANDGLAYAGRLAELVTKLADQVSLYRQSETPWYPGVMLRVALDTTAIRGKTPAGEPLDEQFAPQVSKKAGESVELEITIYNWLEKTITGTIKPVLPDNWQAQQAVFPYNITPGNSLRITTMVTIPADSKPEIYPLGAETSYLGVIQRELHTHRVLVEK